PYTRLYNLSLHDALPISREVQTNSRIQAGGAKGVILVGELSLWVALLMAAWAATVSFAGGQMRRVDLIESGERAIYATLAMVVLDRKSTRLNSSHVATSY